MGTQLAGPSTEIDCSFPLDPRAPGEARRLLASLRGRVPPEVLIDLALLVSETVTNSLQHSGRSDQIVDVSIRAGPDAVRVEVRDGGPGFEPIPLRAPPPAGGGWGLFIVDRLGTPVGNKARRRGVGGVGLPRHGTPAGGIGGQVARVILRHGS